MAIILSESHIRSVVAEAFKISSQGGGGSSFSVTGLKNTGVLPKKPRLKLKLAHNKKVARHGVLLSYLQ